MPFPDSQYPSVIRGYSERESQRLLAAAPLLLDACRLLLFQGGSQYACYCKDPDFEFNGGGDKCDNCIAAAAIAKAEGRGE